MSISAVFIGNELLNGQTTNSNLVELGRFLSRHSYKLDSSRSVPDDYDFIQKVLEQEKNNSRVIIIVGGLGPTSDDLTREAVAGFLGRSLETHSGVMASLTTYMQNRGREIDAQWLQRSSEWIAGAELLENHVGLAPGLRLDEDGRTYILLPGPPREFMPMLEDQVLETLTALLPVDTVIFEKRLFGLPESAVESAMQPLLQDYKQVLPAYCAQMGSVRLTLSLPHSEKSCLGELEREVVKIFSEKVLKTGDVCQDVIDTLQDQGLTLATAESCTGGMISAAITDRAGSSEYFMGAYVTYQNSWKEQELSVPIHILEEKGAVSVECADAMIRGLIKTSGVDAGIAVTGIAGPGGASDEKPVGLVYIATAFKGKYEVGEYHFRGSRTDVRRQARDFAFNQLRLQTLIK